MLLRRENVFPACAIAKRPRNLNIQADLIFVDMHQGRLVSPAFGLAPQTGHTRAKQGVTARQEVCGSSCDLLLSTDGWGVMAPGWVRV